MDVLVSVRREIPDRVMKSGIGNVDDMNIA